MIELDGTQTNRIVAKLREALLKNNEMTMKIDLVHTSQQLRRFRVADLVVDLDKQTVSRNGSVLDLPELSYRLLAVEIRARGVIFLRQDPSLNGLRDDPRYIALLESIGLQ